MSSLRKALRRRGPTPGLAAMHAAADASANGSKGPPPPPPPPKAKASAPKTGAIDKFVQRDVRVTDTRKTSFRPPHALRDHYEQLISAHGRAKAVAKAIQR